MQCETKEAKIPTVNMFLLIGSIRSKREIVYVSHFILNYLTIFRLISVSLKNFSHWIMITKDETAVLKKLN